MSVCGYECAFVQKASVYRVFMCIDDVKEASLPFFPDAWL